MKIDRKLKTIWNCVSDLQRDSNISQHVFETFQRGMIFIGWFWFQSEKIGKRTFSVALEINVKDFFRRIYCASALTFVLVTLKYTLTHLFYFWENSSKGGEKSWKTLTMNTHFSLKIFFLPTSYLKYTKQFIKNDWWWFEYQTLYPPWCKFKPPKFSTPSPSIKTSNVFNFFKHFYYNFPRFYTSFQESK